MSQVARQATRQWCTVAPMGKHGVHASGRRVALSLVAAFSLACADSGGDEGMDEVGMTEDSEESTATDSSGSSSDETGTDAETGTDTDTGVACTYPEGAVEPMALDAVMSPYSWPGAVRADGTVAFLDLAKAPCADDEAIDWSIHDLLVFISIPAW